MKKISIILLACLIGCTKLQAQGIDAGLYQYNYSLIHPSFAGNNGQRISILANRGSFQDYALGIAIVSYENYAHKLNSGVAITGYAERIGLQTVTSLALSYNYHFKLSESVTFIPGVRTGRYMYSVDIGAYRLIQPSDPLINSNSNLSAAGWFADFGLLLKVRKFDFGLLANNLLFTKNKTSTSGALYEPEKIYTALAGTSFRLSDRLSTDHSIYFPVKNEFQRIDLNNTLTINKMFIAGVSVEITQQNAFTRFNTGLKIKDYFRILFLVYSQKGNEVLSNSDFYEPEFLREIYVDFKF